MFLFGFVSVDLFFIPSQNIPVYVVAHVHCTFPYPSNEHVPPLRHGWFSSHAVKDSIFNLVFYFIIPEK